MRQVFTCVHNKASAMTVSIHCWQFYCTSCYLQSLSHHGGAVSGARVLQNSRFQPWQSMQNHRLNSQVRSPAVAGFSTSSGRCQECQDQSLCNTVALTNTVMLLLQEPCGWWALASAVCWAIWSCCALAWLPGALLLLPPSARQAQTALVLICKPLLLSLSLPKESRGSTDLHLTVKVLGL